MIQRTARSSSHSEFQSTRWFSQLTLASGDMKRCFDPVVDTIIAMLDKQVKDVVKDGSPPVQVFHRRLSLPSFN